jgi:hypothetical protein
MASPLANMALGMRAAEKLHGTAAVCASKMQGVVSVN